MSNVSLERYYFVLYDGALTLKMSKMVLNPFCDKTLHMHLIYSSIIIYLPTYLQHFEMKEEGMNSNKLYKSFYYKMVILQIVGET